MPVSIVHKTSADNKVSCSKYGFYLNKENQEYLKANQPEKQQMFFTNQSNNISTINAIDLIDKNAKGKGLKKAQDKYFTVTLNFSDKELRHIAKQVSSKSIKTIDDLNTNEYKAYNKAVRDYTRKAMRNYADNFNKEIKANDIVWTAKIEHQRKFQGKDGQVLNGRAKSGQLKPGLNTHVHITVSRMHKDYRISLSPLANARDSKNLVLNGKSVKGGFDRSNWKQLNEDTFDKHFNYNRPLDEKFKTLNTFKNGSLEEKREVKNQIELKQKSRSKTQQMEL